MPGIEQTIPFRGYSLGLTHPPPTFWRKKHLFWEIFIVFSQSYVIEGSLRGPAFGLLLTISLYSGGGDLFREEDGRVGTKFHTTFFFFNFGDLALHWVKWRQDRTEREGVVFATLPMAIVGSQSIAKPWPGEDSFLQDLLFEHNGACHGGQLSPTRGQLASFWDGCAISSFHVSREKCAAKCSISFLRCMIFFLLFSL